MQCDMCGKSEEYTLLANVEDVKMNLCKPCSKFGKVISQSNKKQTFKPKIKSTPETIFLVVNDFGKKIRQARDALNLTQEELAKKLNEKESLIQKIESEHKEPSIGTGRKLEKFLRIKLIQEHEEVATSKTESSSQGMTIGDMIKLK